MLFSDGIFFLWLHLYFLLLLDFLTCLLYSQWQEINNNVKPVLGQELCRNHQSSEAYEHRH